MGFIKAKYLIIFLIIFFVFGFSSCIKDDVQILKTEKVEDNEIPTEEVEEDKELFAEPGNIVKLSSLIEVDPVGTFMAEDFDGDGIRNADEITTNAWVANYPKIEAYIAPPVTINIAVQSETTSETVSIGSEITSSNTESKTDKSSDAVHNNEITLKTVQYQDSYNNSNSDSHSDEKSKNSSWNANASMKIGGFGIGGGGGKSSGSSSKVSDSHSDSYGETKTKWADKPFKNNTERHGWSLKGNDATRNAVDLRNELRTKTSQSYKITPNSGYVRASMYIKNESVNMPVKINNILCSLMFEDSTGQLIPVQSFRLRNDDYSMFEIEVYGQETFGPYVVEINNLNTHEIQEAIEKGYNPKIFIVDYDMRHVEDSNYKGMLSDLFTGDNLKIIEENAKGRTAGIRLIGPNLRKFYRVTAFTPKAGELDTDEDQLGSSSADRLSAGTSLKKALERLQYSGEKIEFANYIMDFSGMTPEMSFGDYAKPMFMVTAIKSINGIDTKIPLVEEIEQPVLLSDGETYAYLTKPVSDWDEDDAKSFKAWVVMADSKFFGYTNDVKNGDTTLDLRLNESVNSIAFENRDGEKTFPVVEGVNSTIWPGDHYDIVYMQMSEYLEMLKSFGHTPFDTGEKLTFNTRWKKSDLGEHPFYPDTKSEFLGKVALGDTIQFKIKLNWTKYLNPNFGKLKEVNNFGYYDDFSYDMALDTTDKDFLIHEAIDFELNFASGGDYTDWLNLMPKRMPDSIFNEYYSVIDDEHYDNITYLWDFMNQEFIVSIKLPGYTDIGEFFDGYFPGSDEYGLVNVFIRTGHNTAYRETIWPLTDAKKFRGFLYKIENGVDENTGEITYEENKFTLKDFVGDLSDSDKILFYGNDKACTISNIIRNEEEKEITITCNESITEIKNGSHVYVDYGEDKVKLKPEISVNKALSIFNMNYLNYILWGDENAIQYDYHFFNETKKLGFVSSDIISNWLGNSNSNNPTWNYWSDSSAYENFLSENFNPFLIINQYNSLEEWTTRVSISLNQPEFEFFEDTDSNYQLSNIYNEKVFISSIIGNTFKGDVVDIKNNKIIKSINISSYDVGKIISYKTKIIDENRIVIIAHKREIINIYGIEQDYLLGKVIDIRDNIYVNSFSNIYEGILDKLEKIITDNNNQLFITYKNGENIYGKLVKLDDISGGTQDISINNFKNFDLLFDGEQILIVGVVKNTNTDNYDTISIWKININSQSLSKEFIISRGYSGEYDLGQLYIGKKWNNISIARKYQSYILKHTVYDLDEGVFIVDGALPVTDFSNFEISFYGDKAFIYGKAMSLLDNKNYLVGQYVDFMTGEKIGNQVLIGEASQNNSDYSSGSDIAASTGWSSLGASVTLSENSAFAVWRKTENDVDVLKGRNIDLHSTFEHIEDGLNYFFKAPLIEREYEVEAKIVK